jgi:hypothetical protein
MIGVGSLIALATALNLSGFYDGDCRLLGGRR